MALQFYCYIHTICIMKNPCFFLFRCFLLSSVTGHIFTDAYPLLLYSIFHPFNCSLLAGPHSFFSQHVFPIFTTIRRPNEPQSLNRCCFPFPFRLIFIVLSHSPQPATEYSRKMQMLTFLIRDIYISIRVDFVVICMRMSWKKRKKNCTAATVAI